MLIFNRLTGGFFMRKKNGRQNQMPTVLSLKKIRNYENRENKVNVFYIIILFRNNIN
jgi:hypothetical protein